VETRQTHLTRLATRFSKSRDAVHTAMYWSPITENTRRKSKRALHRRRSEQGVPYVFHARAVTGEASLPLH